VEENNIISNLQSTNFIQSQPKKEKGNGQFDKDFYLANFAAQLSKLGRF
jgi:hypothetical protein